MIRTTDSVLYFWNYIVQSVTLHADILCIYKWFALMLRIKMHISFYFPPHKASVISAYFSSVPYYHRSTVWFVSQTHATATSTGISSQYDFSESRRACNHTYIYAFLVVVGDTIEINQLPVTTAAYIMLGHWKRRKTSKPWNHATRQQHLNFAAVVLRFRKLNG